MAQRSPLQLVRSLADKEKIILNEIVKMCMESGSLEVLFKYKVMGDLISSSPDSTRMQIKNMIKKGALNKLPSKTGRSGYNNFTISQELYYYILHKEQNFSLNPKQTRSYSETKPETKPETNSPTTTTFKDKSYSSKGREEQKPEGSTLPEEWRQIEIPQFLKDKGFHPGHVKQIYQSKLKYSSDREDITALSVQESFDHFSYDLENGHCKPLGSAVSYFMKVLRSEGLNWVSEAVVEAERAQFEKLKKTKLAKQKLEEEKEKELISSKIKNIADSLTDERKKQILAPKTLVAEFNSVSYERLLESKIKEIIETEGLGFFNEDLNDSDSFKDELKNLDQTL
jgi:hypothetical protein